MCTPENEFFDLAFVRSQVSEFSCEARNDATWARMKGTMSVVCSMVLRNELVKETANARAVQSATKLIYREDVSTE